MADDAVKTEVSKIRKPSASLVADVLLKSGRLEKEDINACVNKTLQKAEEVKVGLPKLNNYLMFVHKMFGIMIKELTRKSRH